MAERIDNFPPYCFGTQKEKAHFLWANFMIIVVLSNLKDT